MSSRLPLWEERERERFSKERKSCYIESIILSQFSKLISFFRDFPNIQSEHKGLNDCFRTNYPVCELLDLFYLFFSLLFISISSVGWIMEKMS